jgi:hypothetical protein
MLHMTESTTHHPALHSAHFDGSLALLRELAVTVDLDAAWPRLSAIASRMLPHDALRMACFDQGGQLVVNASTADVPEMTASERDELIIDDLRTATPAASADAHATEWLIDAGYRSFLGVSTRAPEPLVQVAFWSKRPLAFDRTQVPLARWIAYHLGLGVGRGRVGTVSAPIDNVRPQRVDVSVQRGVDRLKAGTNVRVVGESVEWRDVLRKAAQVAPTETTVLVTGESGTGKEVVARFVHAASVRGAGPFVALNCAALPEQLLEAELFGYERGAFTSAHQSKPGQVELASGGVLFLDEVSEMSLLGAGEVPAGAAGARVPAPWRHAPPQGEHPRDRRDQPRPAKSRRARRISRGLVLPPRRLRHPDSAVARPSRRHRAAERGVPAGDRQGVGTAASWTDVRCAAGAAPA